jgi:hypothetical protein
MAGETRCVRPLKPWRPSKLRFEVEAQRSPGLQLVGVHGQAHRAARLAPFEAGGDEDLVEALGLGLRLHEARARHDHGVDARRHLLRPSAIFGGGAQVLDAAVGAGADEDAVDLDVGDLRAGLQAHVFERAPILERLFSSAISSGSAPCR